MICSRVHIAFIIRGGGGGCGGGGGGVVDEAALGILMIFISPPLKMQQMPFTNVQGYFSKVTSIYFPGSHTLAASVSHDRIQFPPGQEGSNDNVLS